MDENDRHIRQAILWVDVRTSDPARRLQAQGDSRRRWATNSDLWMQTHADVSNIPISFTGVGDAPALGSAILAAVGAGIYSDIQTAARNMVHVERQIEPDQGRHDEYQFYVDK